jgi:hypothetical protein
LKDSNQWMVSCKEIQQRLLDSTNLKTHKAKALRTNIYRYLTKACDEGILKDKLSDINKLLQMTSPSKGRVEILGGVRNFKRRKEIPHFERRDGCWFDFSIMIDESISEIIGFDFEIRFPENSSVQFLRFDLNLPEHDNEANGLRFHIHPGNDDLMIPSAPMNPLEILYLFLYGLQLKDDRKPRAINQETRILKG